MSTVCQCLNISSAESGKGERDEMHAYQQQAAVDASLDRIGKWGYTSIYVELSTLGDRVTRGRHRCREETGSGRDAQSAE